jgi:hypothetical protein
VEDCSSFGDVFEGDHRSLVSSFLSLPNHEVSSFALPHAPGLPCCLTTGSKAVGATDHCGG